MSNIATKEPVKTAKKTSDNFAYNFPSIRGVQAQQEYYISQIPVRLIPRIFFLEMEDIPVELRHQRILNRTRIPKISNYILENRDSYIFPAITVFLDGKVKFQPQKKDSDLGTLEVNMEAMFLLIDGQHRAAALQSAMEDCSEIGNETISVVFFMDSGLQRCQQSFSDINQNTKKPNNSIGILFDYRDPLGQVTKKLCKSKTFKGLVEKEKTNLPGNSLYMVTISALHFANKSLLNGLSQENVNKDYALLSSYWETVMKLFPEWQKVQKKQLTAGEVREEYAFPQGSCISALGRLGNELLKDHTDWKTKLQKLKKVNWKKSGKLWQGRCIIGGKVSKSNQAVILTTNILKKQLGLPLTEDQKKAEEEFKKGRTAK